MKTHGTALVFPGGGVYFYWMLGVVGYLHMHWPDLGDTPLVGASAGSLAAVFLACGVGGEGVVRAAFRAVRRHRVHDRWLGLCGVWKPIVREWLEEVLPHDAHQRCGGRVHILLTTLWCRTRVVSHFPSREALVDCLLASTHIPFFMDYRPFCRYDGMLCYDNDWWRTDYRVLDGDHHYLFFHYAQDGLLLRDAVRFRDEQACLDLVAQGVRYAQSLLFLDNGLS
jgi:hypothetical protein